MYKKPAIRMCAAILPSLVCDSSLKTYSGALGSKERDDEEDDMYEDLFN